MSPNVDRGDTACYIKLINSFKNITIKWPTIVSVEEIPPEDNYDSDSSLTQAVNRSLDLSRSLGDRCAEITQGESSDEEEIELSDRQEINQASKEGEREEKVEDEIKVADMEPVHIVDVS